MTRRKLVMGQRSQEEGNSCTMWELPTHWTAAQALAVFEVLDDLRDLVVAGSERVNDFATPCFMNLRCRV